MLRCNIQTRVSHLCHCDLSAQYYIYLHVEVAADVLIHFLSNTNVPQFINNTNGQIKLITYV